MLVHGREVKFLKTVGAVCEIAEHCPGKDLKNITALWANTTDVDMANNFAIIICAMSKGYESAQKWEDPEYTPNPVTVEELMSIDYDTFMGLFREATVAFYGDEQTVEAEEPKKKDHKTETLD